MCAGRHGGKRRSGFPSEHDLRPFMEAYLLPWMADFGANGVRTIRVNTVAN